MMAELANELDADLTANSLKISDDLLSVDHLEIATALQV